MRQFSSLSLLLALVAIAPLHAADDSVARMKKDLYYLAGDECEGRGLKTEGINKAADYIAAQFKAAGLKPAFADGYFQPFGIKFSFLEAGPHKPLSRDPKKENRPRVQQGLSRSPV